MNGIMEVQMKSTKKKFYFDYFRLSILSRKIFFGKRVKAGFFCKRLWRFNIEGDPLQSQV